MGAAVLRDVSGAPPAEAEAAGYLGATQAPAARGGAAGAPAPFDKWSVDPDAQSE